MRSGRENLLGTVTVIPGHETSREGARAEKADSQPRGCWSGKWLCPAEASFWGQGDARKLDRGDRRAIRTERQGTAGLRQ